MGMSIVVVTHELDSAFRIADRITMLDRGKILMVGTPEEMKASDNSRIQNLLNRRIEEEDLDPDAYLRRLTGEDQSNERA
jgi:phospholipid/cholesterol/gamma-HCH transport system ATP-binding protein